MTEQQRAQAIYDLQATAREHERLEKQRDDIVIAAMELDFIWGGVSD